MKGIAHDGRVVLGEHRAGSPRICFTKGGRGSGRPVDDDSVTGWVGAYLAAVVHGVSSAEVTGKIARHPDRFAAFLLDGFGHDRIGTVPPTVPLYWRAAPIGIRPLGRRVPRVSAKSCLAA